MSSTLTPQASLQGSPQASSQTPSQVSSPSGTASPQPSRHGAVWRWIGAAAVLTIGAMTLALLNSGSAAERDALSPVSASPEGAKAIVQVLSEHGVKVEIAEGTSEAERLLGAGAATLVMTSPEIASDAAIENIRSLAADADLTVLLTADEKVLRDFAFGEFSETPGEGRVSEPGRAGCPAAVFARVGEISAPALFEPAEGVTPCFIDGEGRAALLFADVPPGPSAHASVSSETATARVALIEASETFDNAHLAEHGNAALAFALFGAEDRVVWYVPSAADLAADRAGTLAALTPKWVTPAMLLLVLTAIVAAVWRGRRFGPLVEERLPVTVRASETMLGRARLAARSGDAAHAAEALREGAIRRLARRRGLPRTASAQQIAQALPNEPSLDLLLTGALPRSDAELVDYARALGAILDRNDPQPHAFAGPTLPGTTEHSDPTDTTDERATP